MSLNTKRNNEDHTLGIIFDPESERKIKGTKCIVKCCQVIKRKPISTPDRQGCIRMQLITNSDTKFLMYQNQGKLVSETNISIH
jgi:hypothetical protein